MYTIWDKHHNCGLAKDELKKINTSFIVSNFVPHVPYRFFLVDAFITFYILILNHGHFYIDT